MAHPMIDQLRFTRGEWLRVLEGISDEDGRQQLLSMSSIGWTVGHLAWQEQSFWLTFKQGPAPIAELNTLVGYGRPKSTPVLSEMINIWRTITTATDPWFDAVTDEKLQEPIQIRGWMMTTYGSLLLRVLYHYWFHIGEIMAIRQQLGHSDLPEFVGTMDFEGTLSS